LDALEHADTVTCKTDLRKSYEVGVTIQRSQSSLTKIITFTPYYLIYNTTENPIELKEQESKNDRYLLIGPGEMLPFWPEHGATQVRERSNMIILDLLFVVDRKTNSFSF
jgi:vacuolar protein sorting-associated protein 13A/C